MDDVVRHYVEECDLMQGFHASFDNDSFGGFANTLLESMKDEYPKTALLSVPFMNTKSAPSTVTLNVGIPDWEEGLALNIHL